MESLEQRVARLEQLLNSKVESQGFSITDLFNEHRHNGIDSPKVSFSDIIVTPRPAIDAPSGGITIDGEARNAIDSIITELEQRNFNLPN